MAEQERKQTKKTRSGDGAEAAESVEAPVKGELVVKIDDLLDEIDSVLEENAEEFVRNYVQKGGQ
ncbi:MAG: ubiquitin-like protein Pup [Actinobacteria bacterium]|jgi:ubiquitin-like protein Pup|nr:ubiquitin-like protein Pup [Actinomycetota bacterium]MBU1493664.1 ubiquitin-like protein Pup [Actinomycetota bacterium]MBU1864909.1 ubiquitin-like protein Pup [Actinomycetota bacterium]